MWLHTSLGACDKECVLSTAILALLWTFWFECYNRNRNISAVALEQASHIGNGAIKPHPVIFQGKQWLHMLSDDHRD